MLEFFREYLGDSTNSRKVRQRSALAFKTVCGFKNANNEVCFFLSETKD